MALELFIPTVQSLRLADQRAARMRILTAELERIHLGDQATGLSGETHEEWASYPGNQPMARE